MQALLPRYAFAPEVLIRINLPVLLFSVAVGLGTGVVLGLWPALQLSRTPAGQLMQSNERRVSGSVRGRRIHRVLIGVQIALTLVLLAAAGSALKGFSRMMHKPLGYDPHNVMSIGIPLHDNSYTTWAGRAAYFEQLRAKSAEVPGVTWAAVSANATPPHNGWTTRFEILGKPAGEDQIVSFNLVSPEFFTAVRIPLREGRIWTAAENHAGSRVAIVNRTLAQRYFPNGDAIGRSVRIPGAANSPPVTLTTPNLENSWLPIVGIVEDALNEGLRKPIKPAIYVPYTLMLGDGLQMLVWYGPRSR
jgi:hypothetical protein